MVKGHQSVEGTRSPCRGFSLIETLIAVVIVGMSVLAIIGGINFCLGAVQSNREWTRSTDILLNEAEKLTLVSWETLASGQYPTNFYALMYPELDAETNLVQALQNRSVTDESSNVIGFLNEEGGTNLIDKFNPLFVGSVALTNFLVTNNLEYNTNMVQATLTVYWSCGCNSRLKTNTLQFILARNGVTHFQEHPAKPIPEVQWTNVLEFLVTRRAEEEADAQ